MDVWWSSYPSLKYCFSRNITSNPGSYPPPYLLALLSRENVLSAYHCRSYCPSKPNPPFASHASAPTSQVELKYWGGHAISVVFWRDLYTQMTRTSEYWKYEEVYCRCKRIFRTFIQPTGNDVTRFESSESSRHLALSFTRPISNLLHLHIDLAMPVQIDWYDLSCHCRIAKYGIPI